MSEGKEYCEKFLLMEHLQTFSNLKLEAKKWIPKGKPLLICSAVIIVKIKCQILWQITDSLLILFL